MVKLCKPDRSYTVAFPDLGTKHTPPHHNKFLFHTGPKCIPFCTREYNPQCGSDGKTYGNPCKMRHATCKSNGKITLAKPGKCREYLQIFLC